MNLYKYNQGTNFIDYKNFKMLKVKALNFLNTFLHAFLCKQFENIISFIHDITKKSIGNISRIISIHVIIKKLKVFIIYDSLIFLTSLTLLILSTLLILLILNWCTFN